MVIPVVAGSHITQIDPGETFIEGVLQFGAIVEQLNIPVGIKFHEWEYQ